MSVPAHDGGASEETVLIRRASFAVDATDNHTFTTRRLKGTLLNANHVSLESGH